jgi:hypothetical protein
MRRNVRMLCCFCAGIGLLALAAVARSSPLRGDPDSTGILALDCSLFLDDRNVTLVSVLFGPDKNERDTRPWLVRADAPKKWIAAGRKDELYFFGDLRPGRYLLRKLASYLPVYMVPGEKPSGPYDGFRSLDYEFRPATRELLSAEVTPGSVTYLGRVDVIDATHRDEKGFHFVRDADKPGIVVRFKRDSLSEVVALRSLRKAARATPWEARLNALPDTALHAAPRDTTLPLY